MMTKRKCRVKTGHHAAGSWCWFYGFSGCHRRRSTRLEFGVEAMLSWPKARRIFSQNRFGKLPLGLEQRVSVMVDPKFINSCAIPNISDVGSYGQALKNPACLSVFSALETHSGNAAVYSQRKLE